jgi:hypothetical protein
MLGEVCDEARIDSCDVEGRLAKGSDKPLSVVAAVLENVANSAFEKMARVLMRLGIVITEDLLN